MGKRDQILSGCTGFYTINGSALTTGPAVADWPPGSLPCIIRPKFKRYQIDTNLTIQLNMRTCLETRQDEGKRECTPCIVPAPMRKGETPNICMHRWGKVRELQKTPARSRSSFWIWNRNGPRLSKTLFRSSRKNYWVPHEFKRRLVHFIKSNNCKGNYLVRRTDSIGTAEVTKYFPKWFVSCAAGARVGGEGRK